MRDYKKLVLAAMLLAAGMERKAEATIVVSSYTTVAPIVLVATPTASGAKIILKGCAFSNGIIPVLDTCVNFVDMTSTNTIRASLCATKNTTQYLPSGVAASGNYMQGTPGSVPQFFGEDLVFSGAFTVASDTPAARGPNVTCSYLIK